ncbi:hypothetical protein LOZ65_000163 [Ophidiomyces ophidiicola]|nr:hypothetical protein LOZ65_000163 [Ophidiomyces ophidiicola]
MAVPAEVPKSYEALVQLERSSYGSPQDHLREAARIIGVDLDTILQIESEGAKSAPGVLPAAAPKEEWVLRWLLKKLTAPASKTTSNYRLENLTWTLFHLLLDRIPARTVAILLTENKFLLVLQTSLEELRELISSQSSTSDAPRDDGSAGKKHAKSGKKRKRTEDDAADSGPQRSSTAPNSPADTFMSVIAAVKHLVELADRVPAAQAALKAQLKLVLRGDPATAANILSQALQSAAVTGRMTERLFIGLSTVLGIWNLRSESLDGSVSLSNGLFCSRVLGPALQLLLNIASTQDETRTRHPLVQAVERLVVLHVTLPLRELFFSTPTNNKNAQDDRVSPDTIDTISKEFASRLGDDANIAPVLLSILLDISTRALPRDTFKRQMNEAAWLETLFVVLSARAGFDLYTDSRKKSDPAILQSLFQVAIDRTFTLSLGTLVRYTVRFAGLLQSSRGEIPWKLISQVIELGVDVFLPNSGLSESKPLLDSLVTCLTSVCQSPQQPCEAAYTSVKSGVVLPLLKGFFAARDGDAFLQIWSSQLKLLDTRRSESTDLPPFSVWEDDDISRAYGELLSVNYSSARVESQIERVVSALSNSDDIPTAYADVVVLDSMLMVGSEKDRKLQSGLSCGNVLEALIAFIKSSSNAFWKWRLWRISRNVIDASGAPNNTLPETVATSMLPTALETIEQFCKKTPASTNIAQCQEVFWSCKFATCFAEELEEAAVTRYLDKLVSILCVLLRNSPEFAGVGWNGRIETLHSHQTVAIGCLATLLSNNKALGLLSVESRRKLFLVFLSAAYPTEATQSKEVVRNETPEDSCPQLPDLWHDFVSYDFLRTSLNVVYDLTFVLSEQLKDSKKNREFLVKSLLNIPVKLMPRHQRGSLLDLLEQILMETPKPTTKVDIVSLMAKLVAAPKSPAKITSDSKNLWKLAASVSTQDVRAESDFFRAFDQLHCAVVSKMLTPSGELDTFGEETFAMVSEIGGKLATINLDTAEHYLLFLSLNLLHKHQTDFDDRKRKHIQTLRAKTFKKFVSDLKTLSRKLKKEPSKPDLVVGILEISKTLEDFIRKDKKALRYFQKLDKYLSVSSCAESIRNAVKRQKMSYETTESEVTTSLLSYAPFLKIHQLQTRDQKLSVHTIYAQLSSLPKEALVGFIHDSRISISSGEHLAYRLLLIGMALALLDPIEDRESSESLELTTTFTEITEILTKCTSIEAFSLASECLDNILRTQARSVSQWNVDNIIATFAIIASPAGPQIARCDAGAVYTRTCRLLGTILGLYRKKMSGRLHLVLPVLQQLLRCLFSGDSRPMKQSRFLSTLPPWLGSRGPTPLTAEHAGQYTRLLTSLCDPTVSAVENHRGGFSQGLSDNTKKVKSLVSQHLQYLIIEYAGLQLRGHLTPDVKAVLMPGWYAVLDVMSKTTLRAMNASMDSSSRAVFKGLYDDYVKFGRWNHD